MTASPIPEGYHTATPYLIVRGAARAIDFYCQVFDATELLRLPMADGNLGHAEFRIGNSIIMLADESPNCEFYSPQKLGGTPVSIMLYVENVDEMFQRAVEAGAEILRPVSDQFYGDRSGTLRDPFGHVWTISTHVEDVPPEELNRRMKQFVESGASSS